MTAMNITDNDLTNPEAETRRQVTAYNDNVGEMLDGVFGGTIDALDERRSRTSSRTSVEPWLATRMSQSGHTQPTTTSRSSWTCSKTCRNSGLKGATVPPYT